MLRFDFHLHTAASPDGEQTGAALVAAAKEKGLTHVAITDHYEAQAADPALFVGDDGPRWFDAAVDRYREVIAHSHREIEAARAAAGDSLFVAAGLELGSPLEDLPRTEEILAAYPYDFLLGSLHANPHRPDFYYLSKQEGVDFGKELDTYFSSLLALVSWGKFHALAHLTYPFRYLPKEWTAHPRWDEPIREVLRALADKGLALELNLSGLRKPSGETCPAPTVLSWFRELGGEYVTIGSDAHRAADVGVGTVCALDLLEAAGFSYLTRYERGVALPQKIR